MAFWNRKERIVFDIMMLVLLKELKSYLEDINLRRKEVGKNDISKKISKGRRKRLE